MPVAGSGAPNGHPGENPTTVMKSSHAIIESPVDSK